MSPRLPKTGRDARREEVRGSGPGGRVELTDIRAKLLELRGDVETTTERAKPLIAYGAAAGVVILVAGAFLLGRRAGRRKTTWVEVRRR